MDVMCAQETENQELAFIQVRALERISSSIMGVLLVANRNLTESPVVLK